MKRKLRVGLVYGGRSGEHEVSLQTARAVIGAFDFDKYELIPFFITKQGEWRFGEPLKGPVEDLRELTMEDRPSSGDGWLALMRRTLPGGAASPGNTASAASGAEVDIMFPLLHGTYGEDGTIQGLFEIAGLPYVGAGVLASAVGMDKVTMKKVFAEAGLPQVIYRHFTRAQWERDRDYHLMEIEIAIGYPCFVKPANLGSSVGVTKAANRKELVAAVAEAFRYDRKVVVEESVNAREIEVAVLGNDDPKASVPGEIIPSNDFYDYSAKYIDGKSRMVIPADLPKETAERIRELAVRAFLAVDASGLSRVDFFLRREDGAVLINEINTMPGFTPFSMYPLLWKESGLSYRELLDELIRLGLERYNERQRLQYGYEA